MICEFCYILPKMLLKRVNYVQDVLPGWTFCVQSYLYTEI